jgi:RNA polymerase sigma factor (sigma-70 family)
VLTTSPEIVVTILRSARTPEPDPRLDLVLDAFRREWESLGRRRYPGLGDALDDALQVALLKIISPERIGGLQDTSRVAAWGRSIFIHAVMDVARDLKRHRGQRLPPVQTRIRRTSSASAFRRSTHLPRSWASGRERLAIVGRCIDRLEVAKLRFIEGMPEKEIAERLELSRDGVAGQLKRIRKAIRNALEDPE